mmetsp:Transcript_4855/g.15084  ORF Transcript_4855/g.15084 Transcript_4855/m.15084 type:complete len:302 (-) Transcript_4855:1234-2139(-)
MQPEKQVHSVRSSTSSAGPPCMSIAPLQVAMVSAVLLVVAYGLSFPSVCDKDGTVGIFCKVHTGARWETFPVFLGIAIFAIEGIPTVLAIENSMQEPHRFEEVFDRSQAMLTVVFLTFGTLGYWLYGNNTKSVITLNVQGMWGILVKCLLCLVIALSFPLQFMPAGHVLKMFSEHPLFLRAAGAVLDTELVRTRLPAASGLSVEQTSAYGWAGLKALAVFGAGTVAILFPHFGHMISLLGSVTFSIITFIVPPGLYMTSMRVTPAHSLFKCGGGRRRGRGIKWTEHPFVIAGQGDCGWAEE